MPDIDGAQNEDYDSLPEDEEGIYDEEIVDQNPHRGGSYNDDDDDEREDLYDDERDFEPREIRWG